MDKNRFPGTVAFVETFDADDDAEPTNILSFELLRKAFVTLQTAETELAESILEIALSEEQNPTNSERPDYDIDISIDADKGDRISVSNTENPIVVNARLESIIEAILFVGNQDNRPLDANQIIEKLRNVSADEVEQTVVRLNEHYRERNSPYTIICERGNYWMALRPEFESVRANFFGKVREPRLSQQAIDTLAVVAYRQPITAEEIQHIRRQPCSAILNQLVRRNLLKVNREVQDKKNVVHYYTTPRFLELCQIKSLDDIPNIDELE